MKNIIIAFCLFSCLKIFGQESALLDTNDISARIYADGRLFNGHFEVPKGSGKNTIDQISIWIGGFDPANIFRFAAQSDGKTASEFSYGPIANDYNDPKYISRYNNVWKINKSSIHDHRLNYYKSGYIVPSSIANWPGNGNTANGEAFLLAPYIDWNVNDIYDPENGDFPDIRGDQAIFFMVNDKKAPHTQTNSEPLWIELHGMAYSFVSAPDSSLDQTIFIHLQFINRAPQDLWNLFIGLLADMNIGNKDDDFVGSDTLNDLTYTYNALEHDSIYGITAPIQAIQIIDFGSGFLNAAKPSFINFNHNKHNEPAGTGPPESSLEYYRYVSGSWRDGTPLTRGGIGYNPGSNDSTSYVYDGNPIDTINGSWTEQEAGNIPGDRIGLKTIGPFQVYPYHDICINLALIYARDYDGNHLSAIPKLQQRVKAIEDFHEGTDVHYTCFPISTNVNESNKLKNSISIYPNPSNGIFNLGLNQNLFDKNFKLEIYNVIGTAIKHSNPNSPNGTVGIGTEINQSNNLEIDISSQPAGIYFVRIRNGESVYSEKIVIQ